ncbi:A24 family peptidase [Facilibium subflavum]|uniref:A24 family peptidase n=1 Tax=Facilibium subflavum TaxID=2219058 RepID=UPI000E64C4A4|nr:prepilin peptidase [Facilibium subflavum]
MYLIFALVLMVIAVRFSINDIKLRTIYNKELLLVLPFFIFISIWQANLYSGWLSAMIVFAGGLPFFLLGWMGAGDVKLLMLYALITKSLLLLLVLISFIGGILTLCYIGVYLLKKQWSLLRQRGIPYGVAISIGGLILFILQSLSS